MRAGCRDCGVDTIEIGDYYMLTNVVWRQACPEQSGFLCIDCVERRLGRLLIAADFIDAPINHGDATFHSERLRERLSVYAEAL